MSGIVTINESDSDLMRIKKINQNFKAILSGDAPVGAVASSGFSTATLSLSSNPQFIRSISTPIINSETLSTNIANIARANIESATVGKLDVNCANISSFNANEFYAKTGLVSDFTIGEGTVTGKLAAVEIQADSIQVNTINASKIVFSDGTAVYSGTSLDDAVEDYMNKSASSVAAGINKSAMSAEDIKNRVTDLIADGTASNYVDALNIINGGVDGSTLVKKSITADKIKVKDLTALQATIGGFQIKDTSIEANDGSFVLGKKNGDDVTGYMYVGTNNTHLLVDPDQDRLEMKANTVNVEEDMSFAEKWKLDYQPAGDQFALVYVG